jgi:hypothetical protein
VPSFAGQIHNGPALLATLQALHREFRKFAAMKAATKEDGQNRSITFPGKSLAIG